MKIILSRKGFDGTAGGHASPILPDGKMVSLPIPLRSDRLRYDDIAGPDGKSYGRILDELAAGAKIENRRPHLDPDLIRGSLPRPAGWRPTFGQNGNPGKHLLNQKVSKGDLFLFFGWFCHTEHASEGLRFRPGSDGFHAIFGYLEIGEILLAGPNADLPGWLSDHPHALPSRREAPNNTIYAATQELSFHSGYPGGGAFKFSEQLVLTKTGHKRSRWNLDPDLFRNVNISGHPDPWRDGYFQSTGRGQEFVIDANDRVKVWAYRIVRSSCLWDLD